jgi:hypothetical protein
VQTHCAQYIHPARPRVVRNGRLARYIHPIHAVCSVVTYGACLVQHTVTWGMPVAMLLRSALAVRNTSCTRCNVFVLCMLCAMWYSIATHAVCNCLMHCMLFAMCLCCACCAPYVHAVHVVCRMFLLCTPRAMYSPGQAVCDDILSWYMLAHNMFTWHTLCAIHSTCARQLQWIHLSTSLVQVAIKVIWYKPCAIYSLVKAACNFTHLV